MLKIRMESGARVVLRRCRNNAAKAVRAALLAVVVGVGLSIGAAPVKLVEQDPVSVVKLSDGAYLLDFGRVAFGNLLLAPEPGSEGEVTIRFGEALRDGRIDRNPPGSVSYSEVKATLDGTNEVVTPPPNARNIRPPAVLTPPEWGVLTPFRWVEIEGWPGELRGRVEAESRLRQHLEQPCSELSLFGRDARPSMGPVPLLSQSDDLCRRLCGR